MIKCKCMTGMVCIYKSVSGRKVSGSSNPVDTLLGMPEA